MKTLKSTLLLLAVFCTVLMMQSCEEECADGICDCPIGYIGTNCENFDPAQVQVLLDGGSTPLELLNDNIPLNSFYGAMYEGGLIFYLNPNTGLGMVSAAEDQSVGTPWGCTNQGVNAYGEDIGTGIQNTMEILGGCETPGIAARLCDGLELNGYSDWFLPSKASLDLMWENLVDSDGDGYSGGADHSGNLGGFAAEFYWTSTEFNDGKAWFIFMSSGVHNGDYKGNFNRVRAIRTF